MTAYLSNTFSNGLGLGVLVLTKGAHYYTIIVEVSHSIQGDALIKESALNEVVYRVHIKSHRNHQNIEIQFLFIGNFCRKQHNFTVFMTQEIM